MHFLETFQYGTLFIIGVSAFAGILGAWLFQRLKIPQVVGYIAVGLLLGQTGINLIDPTHGELMRSFTKFALGVIGFLVGGELRIEEFKKYGRQFAGILFGEGLLSFFMVGIATGFVFYLVTHSVVASLSGGLVLAAIASATDPASTIDVLWEYRSKGVLTTAIVAIVALDDALAMSLYGIGKGVATIIAGGQADLTHEMLSILTELGGAILAGIICGAILNFLIRKIDNDDRRQAILIGTLLLCIGVSVTLGLDVIMSTMTLGFVIVNLAPRRSSDIFKLTRSFSIPIYVIFFILVGARLNISGMPGWLWGVVALYVALRSLGKYLGSWFGAKLTKAPETVQKYCGAGLFAQGGVAVGLSILAGENLKEVPMTDSLYLGSVVVSVVTASTLIVQVIGPLMTRMAIFMAKEAGKNITEEDIMQTMSASDVMHTDYPELRVNDSLQKVVSVFSVSSFFILPVMSADGKKTVGTISFELLKSALPEPNMWPWLLVTDLMQECNDHIYRDTTVLNVEKIMKSIHADELIVYSENHEAIGIVDKSNIQKVCHKNYLKAIGQ